MKNCLILITLFTSTFAFAQHHRIGAYFTLTNSFRSIPDGSYPAQQKDEKAILFNTGISYEIPLKRSIAVQTGLEYSTSGYNRWVNPQYTLVYNLKQRLHYVGVPTTVNLRVIPGKFNLHLNVGFVHKLLISASYIPTEVLLWPWAMQQPSPPDKETYSLNELKDQNYNIYNLDLLTDVRFGLSLKRINIGLAPEFRYAMLPTSKSWGYANTPDEHLYSFGLKLIITENGKQ
jgi:hypothetical protein